MKKYFLPYCVFYSILARCQGHRLGCEGIRKVKMLKRNMNDCIGMVRGWGERLKKASRRRCYFIGVLNDLVSLKR